MFVPFPKAEHCHCPDKGSGIDSRKNLQTCLIISKQLWQCQGCVDDCIGELKAEKNWKWVVGVGAYEEEKSTF